MGKYTYVGSTGYSVVDYVLISEAIINAISKFSIGEPNILSDHCAVYFSLCSAKITVQSNNARDIQSGERVSKKFVWKAEKTQNYRDRIDFYEEEFSRLQTGLSQATSGQDINENIERFF